MSESQHAPASPRERLPIFIVGAPRSGTTLLYHMLGVSGVFPVYHAESRILVCAPAYGALWRSHSRERFLTDFLTSRQFRRSGLDEGSLVRDARTCRSYVEFLGLFMDRIAVSQGKERWVEKTPTHIQYLPELARAFPEARFMHVVRDGRAVAASAVKLGWTPELPGGRLARLIWVVKRWQYLTGLGRRFGDRNPDRYMEVRYEDLVLRLPQVLPGIAQFADIRLDPDAVAASQHGSLGRPNTAYGTDSPASGVDRWRLELTPGEAVALTKCATKTLRRYGYEADSVGGEGWRGRARRSLYGGLASLHVRGKEWAKRAPLIGRVARSPLEFEKG